MRYRARMAATDYRSRLLDSLLDEISTQIASVLLVGPRATGKTTTASRRAATIVRLDRPGEAAAFRADPDAALRGLREPVLLDEWQEVPTVLGAVKRALTGAGAARPNRFILTGSVRADLLGETWPGTGRQVRLSMYGMAVREQVGYGGELFLDRVLTGSLAPCGDARDLRDYVELALVSGFPDAIELSGRSRSLWLESYVEQLLTRDTAALDQSRDPTRLRRYLLAYALNSAGVLDHKTIYDTAGIDRKTGAAYEHLLANLFVLESLPAWSTSRLVRMTRMPKRYLLDSGLMGGVLQLDPDRFMRDGDLLGRLLETFVLSQLRPELAVGSSTVNLFHLRTEKGRQEVDLVAEVAGGVVGIEIKASSAVDRRDARHLMWLRDELGAGFLAGVVLHTGAGVFPIADRIVAAPICSLWS